MAVCQSSAYSYGCLPFVRQVKKTAVLTKIHSETLSIQVYIRVHLSARVRILSPPVRYLRKAT